jgi:hypothetical protein
MAVVTLIIASEVVLGQVILGSATGLADTIMRTVVMMIMSAIALIFLGIAYLVIIGPVVYALVILYYYVRWGSDHLDRAARNKLWKNLLILGTLG